MNMLRHAALHSPYYREQSWAEQIRNGANLDLSDIPITSKSIVKSETSAFYSSFVPPAEGAVEDKFTSGSTGEPLRIKKTAQHFRINAHENARLRRGWGNQTGYIRTALPTAEYPIGTVRRNGAKGNNWTLYSQQPAPIIDLLNRTRCSHIGLYPSEAVSVLELGNPLDFLRLISTSGEVVSPELTSLLTAYPACSHYDSYGSVETGLIAAKCRRCGNYHVANQHLILELLDESLQPVQPGQLGRVIVTPIYNMAMPLVRYDLGDLAVLSDIDNCEVDKLGITKIVGREKDLFRLSNGSRIVPMVDAEDVWSLSVKRYKLVQTAVDTVEFVYVPESPEITVEDHQLQPLIDKYMSPLLRAKAIKVATLPRSRSGKYLMHECLLR
jgi:phenylacetate-CoA ligase